MLICLPRSVCSWDFVVEGADGGTAYLGTNWMSEQGYLDFGERLEIRKSGPFSGHWTLEGQGGLFGEAQKTSPFTRTFDLRVAAGEFRLTAESAFTRSFGLLSRGNLVGTIRPAHAFTRRAFIDCAPEVPELAQLFAFWLVAVTWRRRQRRD